MHTMIADTSAIYALIDADDVHHAEAVAFLHHEIEHITLVMIDTTLFEAITLIKSRLGHSAACKALKAIQSSPRFRLVRLTEEDQVETWRIFNQYADKGWSPFDCACLAVAHSRKIREAFAFDQHFNQMSGEGLIRQP